MPTAPHRNRAPFRVQIICDTTLEYFRNVILGVRQYSFETGRIVIGDRWLETAHKDLPRMVRQDRIDGIIAQIHDRAFETRLMHLGIPCVNISNAHIGQRLPLVSQDDREVGRLAGEHLANCGCAAFGLWGQENSAYSQERQDGMQAILKQSSAPFFFAHSPPPEQIGASQLIARMAAWLKDLPKPVGVFAVLDTFGLHLLRAARQVGLRVPEDMAILGAGDDEFWVGYESVPLSSIRLPSRRIGFEAAHLIDSILTKSSVSLLPKRIRLPVSDISQRQSTDVLFTQDIAVQRAVAFLRQQPLGPVRVADVVRFCGVSRSGLQERMRRALGHSILEEIHRVRIARVQTLLRTSDRKIADIAQACGFPDSARLCVLFRKRTGQTPRQYRMQFRH